MRKRNEDIRKGLKPLQIKFFALLGQEAPKPIPPKLVQIFGYPLAAIISQLLFWKGMEIRKDGLIYKTEKDFINELGLSSAQQKLAIKKGKAFGFLKVERKGIPAKRHYAMNFDLLVGATIREADRKHIVLTKSVYKLVDNDPQRTGDMSRTNTDNTTETTARYNSTQSISDLLPKKYKR